MNAEHDDLPREGLGAQLHLNTADSGWHTLDLIPGRTAIGRGPGNGIRLEHPTISETHCEIEVGPEGISVRDLGSTNGTFIDGETIDRAVLKPGQRLRLGEVELLLDDAVPDGSSGAPIPAPESGPGPKADRTRTPCASHPGSRAAWVCTDCHCHWCAACVRQVKLDTRRTVTLCQACDGLCERSDRVGKQASKRGFGAGLVSALSYPLQPAGLLLLAFATVLEVFLSLSGRWFALGGLALLMGLAVGGYVLAFGRQIILSAAEGEETLPAFPEFDIQSLRETVFMILGVSLVCFGPWTICSLWLRPEGEAAQLACHAVLGLGAFFFPMALLAVVIYDDLSALNPILLIVSIARTALRYVSMCLLLGAVVGAGMMAESALQAIGWPRLAGGAGALVPLYSTLVTARAIGWFYYCNQEDLGWSQTAG